MQPIPIEATAAPKRQSCDRCYNQKTRCTRSNNDDAGPCDRCLRKGARCTYSSSLPKGRPSLHRSHEGIPAAKDLSPKTSSVASAIPNQGIPSGSSNNPTDTAPVSSATPVHTELHDEDFTAFSPDDSMSAFADFSAGPWPEDPIGDSMLGVLPSSVSNWEPIPEAQLLASLDSSWQSTRNSNGLGQGHARADGFGLENGSAETISTSISSRGDHTPTTSDKHSFELSIAHLSRLNARLSQLLASSRRFLAEPLDSSRQAKNQDPALQIQHSIETVFRLTNTWLVHGSTNVDATSSLNLGQTNAFNLLHHVFSASNHMLEILQHVRVSVLTSTANLSPTASSSPLASGLSSGLHIETLSRMSSSEGSHDSSSVVRQLVVICVTLLLNMYVAILMALQRSADALNASQRQRSRDPIEPNDHMDRASRIHLQLVSVVQMCSYFIKRQTQALDRMMLSREGPLYTPSSRDCNPLQSVSSDAMSDVRIEVEQRLRQLQESISIIT